MLNVLFVILFTTDYWVVAADFLDVTADPDLLKSPSLQIRGEANEKQQNAEKMKEYPGFCTEKVWRAAHCR